MPGILSRVTYDIVPWMSVETGAQSLLVEEMGNKTNAATENEKTVENTHLKVVLGLFGGEGATVAEQVDEADGDTSINVQDQVVLLAGSDGLNGLGVVEKGGVWEVLVNVLLDKRHTQVRVVARLDTVTDTRNC